MLILTLPITSTDNLHNISPHFTRLTYAAAHMHFYEGPLQPKLSVSCWRSTRRSLPVRSSGNPITNITCWKNSFCRIPWHDRTVSATLAVQAYNYQQYPELASLVRVRVSVSIITSRISPGGYFWIWPDHRHNRLIGGSANISTAFWEVRVCDI